MLFFGTEPPSKDLSDGDGSEHAVDGSVRTPINTRTFGISKMIFHGSAPEKLSTPGKGKRATFLVRRRASVGRRKMAQLGSFLLDQLDSAEAPMTKAAHVKAVGAA